jgi:hypothetical protein
MPVLLLARGDKEGKELLRRALEARYGVGAPAIDTLRIEFKGRKRARIGPVATWVPVEGTLSYNAPLCGRIDYTARPVGLPLITQTDAFDGTIYRKRRGRDEVEVVTQSEQAQSIQRRLWVAAAVLLTPLVEQFVELHATGERSFTATNIDTDDSAHVYLNDDFTIAYATTQCYNAAEDAVQEFTYRLFDGQSQVNDLMLPRRIAAHWEEAPEFEMTPASVEINPTFEPELFRLED